MPIHRIVVDTFLRSSSYSSAAFLPPASMCAAAPLFANLSAARFPSQSIQESTSSLAAASSFVL
jgi:hypothetical protein